MNDFKVIELLYKGDVSDIWQGVHLATNTEVHVVTVNKKLNGNIFDQKRMSELEPTIVQLNHPNLLRYHKIVQNDNTIGIIMDHPKGGCLRDHLLRRADKKLTEQEAKAFFKQIVSAVEYIHKFNIVYRNLNLRNIFIDKNNQIKIGDFLICFKAGPIYKPNTITSSCHFYAPEIWLEEGGKIEQEADIWSLGVLLYVMTCGCYPFDGKNEFDIYLSAKKGQFAIPSFLSDECASLIKMILQTDPSKRATIAQIKSHPWFLGAQGRTHQLSNTLLRGGLGTILEEPDEETPSSSMVHGIKNLSLESNVFQSGQLRTQKFDLKNLPAEAYSILSQISFANTEEKPAVKTGARKRLSTDEDVQKLITNYRNHREEAHNQSVDKLLSNSGISQRGDNAQFQSSFEIDTPIRRESKRRSSDSIIHNEEIMRMLGLSHLAIPSSNQNSLSPFSVSNTVSTESTRGRHIRRSSTGEEIKYSNRKVGVSPGYRKTTSSRRRRNSEDTNQLTSNSTITNLYNNISLPQTGSISDLFNQTNTFQFQPNQNNLKQQVNSQRDSYNLQELINQPPNLIIHNPPSPDNTQQQRSLSLQLADVQIPFMDPELQRELDNLQTSDFDTPDYLSSLLESPDPNVSVDDWISTTTSNLV